MKYLKLFENNNDPIKYFYNVISNLFGIIGLECSYIKDNDWSFYIKFDHNLVSNRTTLISSLLLPIVNYDCIYITTRSPFLGKNTPDGDYKTQYSGKNWNNIYADILDRLIKRYKERDEYLYTSMKGSILIDGKFIINSIIRYLEYLNTFTFDSVKKSNIKMDKVYKIFSEELYDSPDCGKIITYLIKNNKNLYNNLLKHNSILSSKLKNEMENLSGMGMFDSLIYNEEGQRQTKIIRTINRLLQSLGLDSNITEDNKISLGKNLLKHNNSLLFKLIKSYFNNKDINAELSNNTEFILTINNIKSTTPNPYEEDMYYKNIIEQILNYIKESVVISSTDSNELQYIINVISRYLEKLYRIGCDYVYTLNREQIEYIIYDIAFDCIYENKKNGLILYRIMVYDENLFNKFKVIANRKKIVFENNQYLHLKKESPIKKGTVFANINNKPIETGVVLILSNPFKDLNRRIYMGLINRVREDNNTETVRVDLMYQFYILKQYTDGNIYPEKVLMNQQNKKEILNMNNNGLYLNDNKTPLWQVSCGINKINFFNNHQELIKNIPEQYKNVIFPFTNMKEKPNLHL